MVYYYKIHDIDCDHYGRLYARLLIRNAKAKPADMPELRQDNDYRLLATYMKEEVHDYVKKAAKQVLLAHGYPPELVTRILG